MTSPGLDSVAPDPDPELAPYRDEPKQLPSGSLGKDARLRLRFEPRPDRSILAVMERKAPLLVQRAIYCDEGMPELPCVFIITNSGGILQGDRYQIKIEAAADSRGHVTTQAATKIHEMDANHAAQSQEILLEKNAYLEYLPDPVIPFRHARFLTRTRITIDPTATLIYGEILMAGRKYYRDGEHFEFDLFSSTLQAERPDGTRLFVEKFVIEPERVSPRNLGVMGDFDVFGNLILLTPKVHADNLYKKHQPTFDPNGSWVDGISRLPNDAGLIYKVLAHESSVARARIRDFWSLVRPEVTGHPVPKEFAWR